jgi:hypothetical protein
MRLLVGMILLGVWMGTTRAMTGATRQKTVYRQNSDSSTGSDGGAAANMTNSTDDDIDRRRQTGDPCWPYPCQNDGICIRSRNVTTVNGRITFISKSFRCICPRSYSGARCEIALHSCYPDDTLNGPHCTPIRASNDGALQLRETSMKSQRWIKDNNERNQYMYQNWNRAQYWFGHPQEAREKYWFDPPQQRYDSWDADWKLYETALDAECILDGSTDPSPTFSYTAYDPSVFICRFNPMDYFATFEYHRLSLTFFNRTGSCLTVINDLSTYDSVSNDGVIQMGANIPLLWSYLIEPAQRINKTLCASFGPFPNGKQSLGGIAVKLTFCDQFIDPPACM